MRMIQRSLWAFGLMCLFFSSCQKATWVEQENNDVAGIDLYDTRLTYAGWPETIEAGIKTNYTTANVTLSTGSWNFQDAMIGTSSSDRKVGAKAARIQNTGRLTMNFDLTNGASQVTVRHARFSNESSSSWALFVSTNSGSTWSQVGNNVSTTSTTLGTATFNVSFTGNVRFQIRKLSGGRLNIDNITVSDIVMPLFPDNDNYLTMGNPSGAVTDVNVPNNYLLVRSQFVLGYNNSRGGADWVGWHLESADLGTTPRCDCFATDTQLPSTFYRATSTSYSGSGFDRGHQCPSADRTDNAANNAATFLMSNMLPQSPNLNQITWNNMENYERALVNQGNELYIYCGGYGSGGTGSAGGVTFTIDNGRITVPSRCWKVIVAIPAGSDDVSRASQSCRVIAVDMPNNQTVNSQAWGAYRTTVDAIEAATGFNLLSNLPTTVQATVEAAVDNGPTQ